MFVLGGDYLLIGKPAATKVFATSENQNRKNTAPRCPSSENADRSGPRPVPVRATWSDYSAGSPERPATHDRVYPMATTRIKLFLSPGGAGTRGQVYLLTYGAGTGIHEETGAPSARLPETTP